MSTPFATPKRAKPLAQVQPKLAPLHPGEVLREEFMLPLKLSAGHIAKRIGVPRTRIERIAREEIGISGDTAVRLAKLFGTSAQFWMNLQIDFEITSAEEALAGKLDGILALLPEAQA